MKSFPIKIIRIAQKKESNIFIVFKGIYYNNNILGEIPPLCDVCKIVRGEERALKWDNDEMSSVKLDTNKVCLLVFSPPIIYQLGTSRISSAWLENPSNKVAESYVVVAVLVVGVGISDTSERDPNSRDLCSDLVNSPSFPCLHGSEPVYQEDCCKISALAPGE